MRFIVILTLSLVVVTKLIGHREAKAHPSALTKQLSKGGYVINIPLGQAGPLTSKSEVSGQNQLLDFKMAEAGWLTQYSAIHKEVSQIIQSKKKAILESAQSLFREFPKSALLPYRLYVEELKMFSPADPDIVSVRMKLYTYTGGAHGGSHYYSWNYSLKKQQFLSLRDIFPISDYCAELKAVGLKPLFQKKPLEECFKPVSNLDSAIKGSKEFLNLVVHIRELLFENQKQGDEYDKHRKRDILRGTMKHKHFQIWNLKGRQIQFIFPEYQVGSYSAGAFLLHLPLNIRS